VVERFLGKKEVVGSIPTPGLKMMGGRSRAPHQKILVRGEGSIPTPGSYAKKEKTIYKITMQRL
jgi:hypothetical protein